jgi:hypothetical protein
MDIAAVSFVDNVVGVSVRVREKVRLVSGYLEVKDLDPSWLDDDLVLSFVQLGQGLSRLKSPCRVAFNSRSLFRWLIHQTYPIETFQLMKSSLITDIANSLHFTSPTLTALWSTILMEIR